MKIEPLINNKSELFEGGEEPGPVVISSRIRLARNIMNYPFPGWAKEKQRKEIMTTCNEVVQALPEMNKSITLGMSDLKDLEKQVLVERHLMSRELSSGGSGAGVIINEEQSCSIMINEEDHLRIQVLRSGFKLDEIWATINKIDSAIESRIEYAFSADYGYLTACPTNVGTGMRASVMMHLPGLVIGNHMDKVVRAVNQLGIAVRGVLGEGSEASGSVFQISNQQTLGESEEGIILRLSNVLNTIIRQEENARKQLLEASLPKILDKISRAYGTLKSAHILSSSEAMNLLSLMRLSVDLGAMSEDYRRQIDRLFVESQPGHIQMITRKTVEPDMRDELRASFLRDNIENLPSLDFGNINNN